MATYPDQQVALKEQMYVLSGHKLGRKVNLVTQSDSKGMYDEWELVLIKPKGITHQKRSISRFKGDTCSPKN